MSRCFPYLRPGYGKIGTGHESLIESNKKREKAEEDREVKKRKRKEEKNQQNGEIDKKKSVHNKRHKDEKSHNNHKGKEHRKRRKNETEQFEKSSLTEEHEHPVSCQNLRYSSISTLNSSKRQKQCSPIDGSTIRIRLPFKRQKDPKVLPNTKPARSAFANSDDFFQEANDPALGQIEHLDPSTAITSRDLTFILSEDSPCFSSTACEIFAPKALTAAIPCSYDNQAPFNSKFRDLVENWVPPLLQSECTHLEDQEWLFCPQPNLNFETQRFKQADSGSLSSESSTSMPHLCYLSEADIYALPFTLLF
ncbi:hypothetical protein U1Q18_011529 [Sarracenia purpurea var. burkii]